MIRCRSRIVAAGLGLAAAVAACAGPAGSPAADASQDLVDVPATLDVPAAVAPPILAVTDLKPGVKVRCKGDADEHEATSDAVDGTLTVKCWDGDGPLAPKAVWAATTATDQDGLWTQAQADFGGPDGVVETSWRCATGPRGSSAELHPTLTLTATGTAGAPYRLELAVFYPDWRGPGDPAKDPCEVDLPGGAAPTKLETGLAHPVDVTMPATGLTIPVRCKYLVGYGCFGADGPKPMGQQGAATIRLRARPL